MSCLNSKSGSHWRNNGKTKKDGKNPKDSMNALSVAKSLRFTMRAPITINVTQNPFPFFSSISRTNVSILCNLDLFSKTFLRIALERVKYSVYHMFPSVILNTLYSWFMCIDYVYFSCNNVSVNKEIKVIRDDEN